MRGSVLIGLLVGVGVQVRGECSQDDTDFNFYDVDYVKESFANPWTKTDARVHALDPRAEMWGADDCGGIGLDEVGAVFIFGGKNKFGPSNLGRLFDVNSCACTDEDFDDCTTCPEESKLQGIWYPDTANDTLPRPDPREDHVVLQVGADVYISGGIKTNYLDMWKYTVNTIGDGIYTEMSSTSLVNGRKDMCGAVVDGKIYIVGGIDLITKAYVNDVLVFDPQSNEWSMVWNSTSHCANMGVDCPLTREDASCAGINVGPMTGGFLLIGGATPDESLLNDYWYFSVTDKTWTKGASAVVPPAHEDTVASVNDTSKSIILQGGTVGEALMSSIWTLDISKPFAQWNWHEIPTLSPAPLVKDHCGGIVGGKLYSFSGEVDSLGKAPDLYIYDMRSPSFCPNECVGNGVCSNYVCQCNANLVGADCNTKVIQIEYRTIDETTKTALVVIANITGTLCIILCCVYFMLRERPALRATSPYVTIGITFGCALASFGINFLGITTDPLDNSLETLQNATSQCYLISIWYPMCFAIVFGFMFAKIKRVANVFLNKKLQRVKPNQVLRQMLTVFLTVFLVEIAFLVMWLVSDPFDFHWVRTASDSDFIKAYEPSCGGTQTGTFILMLSFGNCIFLCYGAYLGYITRRIRVFADSKGLNLAMYNILAIMAPTVLIAPSLNPTVRFALTAGGIIANVYGIILLLVVPNLMRWRETSEQIMESLKISSSHADGRTSVVGPETAAFDADSGEIAALKSKVADLEARLKAATKQ